MRIFLIITFLGSILHSITNAEDIYELEIAGISLGDSLLKYISKDKIEKIKNETEVFIYDDKTYYSVTIYESMDFAQYDFLQFHLKNNDKDYKIYSISGRIRFKNDINSCYKLMDEIINDLKLNLKNYKLNDVGIRDLENQDGSIAKIKSTYFLLNSGGDIAVHCYDHPKSINITDNLTISLDSPQFVKWLTTKAYK